AAAAGRGDGVHRPSLRGGGRSRPQAAGKRRPHLALPGARRPLPRALRRAVPGPCAGEGGRAENRKTVSGKRVNTMQLYDGTAPVAAERCAAALGFFDGVHLGHRAVIAAADRWAAEHAAETAVFTFDLPLGSRVKA